MLALTPKIIIAITRYQALPGSADPEALPPSIFPRSGGSASIHFPQIRRLCLHPFSPDPEALPPSIFPRSGGSASIHFPQIRRLCLHPFSPDPEALPSSIFPAEAEPLDIGSQAEPRNQLIIPF